MSILPSKQFQEIARGYRERFGLTCRLLLPDGQLDEASRRRSFDALPMVVHTRAHSIQEALRWGEPYVFFIAPNVMSWTVPLVNQQRLEGALSGGEVLSQSDPESRMECVNHLVGTGLSRSSALQFIRDLPIWQPGDTDPARQFLSEEPYQITGWTPFLLEQHRAKASQQRQIAEEIHRRKVAQDIGRPWDEERMLLSLIRAGDQKGARSVLNRLLGSMLMTSPGLTVLRARTIELMGYLVRAAVEDNSGLEPLIEKNHKWMAALIEAPDFESLSECLRKALDEFMKNIHLFGYNPGNAAVREALDYIADHFTEALTLKQVAQKVELSTFRIAHLVKESTGRSIMQHVQMLRIQEARRLLDQSSLSSTEIAYEAGFGDQSYFIKQFKKYMGTTPLKYRRRVWQEEEPVHEKA